MTDDEPAARYEVLRAAAADVVVSARRSRSPAPYTAEWHELHREDGSSGPYELTRLASRRDRPPVPRRPAATSRRSRLLGMTSAGAQQ